MPRSAALAVLATAIIALAGAAGAATLHIYSFDPANDNTRQVAGGLTFDVLQKITSARVLRVRATEAEATAELKSVGQGALGHGGLTALIGRDAPERDLYEVQHKDDGPALISAFCPGAKRAWMSFGHVKDRGDLRVFVLGAGGDGLMRLCQTLDFSFHGEWQLPPGRPFDQRLLERPSMFGN